MCFYEYLPLQHKSPLTSEHVCVCVPCSVTPATAHYTQRDFSMLRVCHREMDADLANTVSIFTRRDWSDKTSIVGLSAPKAFLLKLIKMSRAKSDNSMWLAW